MITCQECESEFTIEHDELDEPQFCPFCGSILVYDDKEFEEEFEEE